MYLQVHWLFCYQDSGVEPIPWVFISDIVCSLLEFPFGSSWFFFLSLHSLGTYFLLYLEHSYDNHFKFLIVNSKYGQSMRFVSNVFSFDNESHFSISLCVKKFWPVSRTWWLIHCGDSGFCYSPPKRYFVLFASSLLGWTQSLNCLFCNRQQLKSKFTYFSLSWTFLSLPHLQVVQGSSWDLGRVYTLNLDFSSLALSFPEFFPNFPLTVISSNSVFWFFGHRLDRTTGY